MPGHSENSVLRYLRSLFVGRTAEGQSDQYLLENFVTQADELAFAALLQRHGPMVMGVSLRILHDEYRAEEVLQATFLVLALRAPSDSQMRFRRQLALRCGPRLARKLKARTRHNLPLARGDVAELPAERSADRTEHHELLAEEPERLPEKYRLPLLLCYFEGCTREEAAAQLGWTVGRVKGLLKQGRNRLRSRLVRRGLVLSPPALATVLGETAWSAKAAPRLSVPTIQAAMNLAAGKTLAECGASASVITLAKGGLSMYPKKMLLVLALLLVGVGAGLWAASARTGPERRLPKPVVADKNRSEQRGDSGQRGDVKKDQDMIQGTWTMVEQNLNGRIFDRNSAFLQFAIKANAIYNGVDRTGQSQWT